MSYFILVQKKSEYLIYPLIIMGNIISPGIKYNEHQSYSYQPKGMA